MLSRCALFFLLVFGLEFGDGARILAISPVPSHSHNVVFSKIVRKLAERGHEVDYISHFREKKKTPGVNDLNIEGLVPGFSNNMTLTFVDDISFFRDAYIIAQMCGPDMCKNIFGTDYAKQIRSGQKKYDLLVTELFGTDCFLGFAKQQDIPTVLVTTTISLPWGNDRFGNPDNPSYIPSYYSSYTNEMNLYERIVNTVLLVVFKIYYEVVSMGPSNVVAKEFFGSNLPDIHDLAQNVSLIVANSHYSINYAKPNVPNYIEVGGIHIDEPKPLPKHLEEIMKTDKEGVILVSMGSLLRTESYDFDKLQAMFDSFAEVPYKVLWKAVKEDFDKSLKIPSNIHFEKWVPQLDVLCHPKTKLFVSHGGALGGQEAVYCGVPRIGVPYFAEQETNIRAAQHAGIAHLVRYNDINRKNFKYALSKLLNDKRVRDKVAEVSRVFRDRPMSAMDTAMYWIEYVIRHKGAPYLRSKGADLPWYQYFLVDVILIGITLVSTVLWLTYFVISRHLRCIFCTAKSEKVKTKGKQKKH